jgi:NTP pyrophosphatase (non-canonical NTP hydrolase)
VDARLTRSRRRENRGRIGEELADVAIGLLLLADRMGLDLPAAIRAKIGRNGEKYPAKRKAS